MVHALTGPTSRRTDLTDVIAVYSGGVKGIACVCGAAAAPADIAGQKMRACADTGTPIGLSGRGGHTFVLTADQIADAQDGTTADKVEQLNKEKAAAKDRRQAEAKAKARRRLQKQYRDLMSAIAKPYKATDEARAERDRWKAEARRMVDAGQVDARTLRWVPANIRG